MTLKQAAMRAVLLLATVLMTVGTAQADRRAGLYGNLLIDDQDDVFFFPQAALQYRNRLSIDYGTGSQSGNALFLMGDESIAFGVALHRGDITVPTAAYFTSIPGLPASGPGLPQLALDAPPRPTDAAVGPTPPDIDPATMLDLMLALDGGFGARLAFGPSAQNQLDADMETGDSEFFVLATVGYGAGERGQETAYDLSASLLFDSASAMVTGDDTASSSVFSLSGLGRAYMPMDDTMDLGIIGAVNVASLTTTDEVSDVEGSRLNLGAIGGVGPAFKFDEASVAAYGTLAFSMINDKPNSDNDDAEFSTQSAVLPGVHVAVEVPLKDWLYVRSGAAYSWRTAATSDKDGENGVESRFGDYGWNAGIGMKLGNVKLDGAISHSLLTSGPNFIGGQSPGFLTMVNFTYDFDALRNGGVQSGTIPDEELEPIDPEQDGVSAPPAESVDPQPLPPAEPQPLTPAPTTEPTAPSTAPVSPTPAPAPAATPEPTGGNPPPLAPLPLPKAPGQ